VRRPLGKLACAAVVLDGGEFPNALQLGEGLVGRLAVLAAHCRANDEFARNANSKDETALHDKPPRLSNPGAHVPDR
jgi:hypothetical protein